MTEERFIQIVEAYGANPARWPETERAAAMAFADAYPDVADAALQAEAREDGGGGGPSRATDRASEGALVRRTAHGLGCARFLLLSFCLT